MQYILQLLFSYFCKLYSPDVRNHISYSVFKMLKKNFFHMLEIVFSRSLKLYFPGVGSRIFPDVEYCTRCCTCNAFHVSVHFVIFASDTIRPRGAFLGSVLCAPLCILKIIKVIISYSVSCSLLIEHLSSRLSNILFEFRLVFLCLSSTTSYR